MIPAPHNNHGHIYTYTPASHDHTENNHTTNKVSDRTGIFFRAIPNKPNNNLDSKNSLKGRISTSPPDNLGKNDIKPY